MTETLDARTAAHMTITADKGKLFAELAQNFAHEQGCEVAHYDRAAGLVYLTDGEPYGWPVLLDWQAARLLVGDLVNNPGAVYCQRCGTYHASGDGMTMFHTAVRFEGGARHAVGDCLGLHQ